MQYIQYVTSGLTLVAFLASIAAWVYKSKSEERERLIRSATEEQRADLVMAALEFFEIDTKDLSKQKKFELVIAQINARAERFRIAAIVVCVIAIILSVVSAFAIFWPDHKVDPVDPVERAPSIAIANWRSGGWEVVVNNPNKSDLSITFSVLAVKRNSGLDLAFFLTRTASVVPKDSATTIDLTLFDLGSGNTTNLASMQNSPARELFDSPDAKCEIQLVFSGLSDKEYTARKEFNCSRIPFPRT